MSRLRPTHVLIGAMALATLIAGCVGAYSYGSAYYQHRGFATIVQLPRAGTGQLLRVHFSSQALHRKADYLVYLPPGYSPAHRYPVYYVLHGMPGRPQVFIDIANMDVRLDNQLSEGHLRPMILVYPDGRIGGSTYSDSEWANTPSGRFEGYVLDVVRDVDHRFAALRDRQDRVIGGFSAGAYGAINIALHNPAAFASVQVWSGYFIQTRVGVFAHASNASLAYNSPLEYVRGLRHALSPDPLRVFMFAGRDDESAKQLVPMARALSARGVATRYAVYPGGHDWSVWYPRLNQMLILASQDMGRAPPFASAAKHRARARAAPVVRRSRVRRSRVRRSKVRHSKVHRSKVQHSKVHRSEGRRSRAHLPLHAYVPPASPSARTPARHRTQHPLLILALLLALASAAAINLGFVLQHRGLARAREGGSSGLSAALTSRTWLAGQAVGWVGFLTQIAAVAIAPLSLVQAFAAGGLAISVPIAAWIFGYRIERAALLAVLVIAASLFSLPIGFTGAHGPLRSGALIGLALLALVAAIALGLSAAPAARAIAAGMFYGVADAAIKADSIVLRLHGAEALSSGWTILAILSTVAGFLAFQAALRDAHAVNAIALMNAFAALAALALGLLAFGESLGTTPAATVTHIVAIALVLACVAPLARAQQQQLAGAAAGAPGDTPEGTGRRAGRVQGASAASGALRVAGVVVAAGPLLLLAALAGTGLLYGLRGLDWFAIGPRMGDSLPLLQLAGFDGQPLPRVIAAWLTVGMVLGLPLIRLRPQHRACLVGALALIVLLFASDASYALARNLPLGQVLWDRAPGLGPWLEALLLAAGSALPRRVGMPSRHALARLLTARNPLPGRTG